MSIRAATATIKGYYYQFDKTILELLNLSTDHESVDIEGIEDVDVHTAKESEAIQCKYLSKPKFINSAVREPITLMLDHFIANNPPLTYFYTLYAHFEGETAGTEPTIDTARLKDILTYKEKKIAKAHHTDNGITDAQLDSFLRQFKFKFGLEFTVQQASVLAKLKSTFKCSDYEADALYYNNSLRLILEKSIDPDITKRKVTRKDFLRGINNKETLYSLWYIASKSKAAYISNIKKGVQDAKALEPSRTKHIFISKEILAADNSKLPIVPFIRSIVDNQFKVLKSLKNAKPPCFILDTDKVSIELIKKELLKSDVDFNDGYESIEFNVNIFNNEPLLNTNKSNVKILRSSYFFKIISLDTFIANQAKINQPKVVLHYSASTCPYPYADSYQLFDIKYCENLQDVLSTII